MINFEEIEKIYPKIPVGSYAKDLTGQKFGELLVLYRTKGKGKSGAARWVCQCSCGSIKDYMAQNLIKNKDFASCGCKNREKASQRIKKYNEEQKTIQIGDRFGKLTVIEYEGLRKQKSREKNESWYICKCDCGNIKSIRGNDLKIGATKSCGCISSYGEYVVEQILKENNIKYKKQYTFSDCKNITTDALFRFDFAIFNNNNELLYLIEYDGRQHFQGYDKNTSWSHAVSFEELQRRDEYKNNYCKDNNILLKRIPYTELSNITIEKIQGNYYNIF